jgi:flagellar basal-body rod protein FlgC
MIKIIFFLSILAFFTGNFKGISISLANEKIISDPLEASIKISSSGMQAQSQRLKVVAQNIANSNVTSKTPNENPYRRKIIFFKNVYNAKLDTKILKVDSVKEDQSEFTLKYEPNHPAADNRGMVKYPNVNIIIETVDSKEAQRTFDANVNSLEIAKTNQNKILELMR